MLILSISFLPHFGGPFYVGCLRNASRLSVLLRSVLEEFQKQPKNRTSHLSEICWCVGDVALSLLFFLPRMSFSRWAVVERNGRLPKERLVKKKQLQSESAAASSFFFSSSSSSLVCIYNFPFCFFRLLWFSLYSQRVCFCSGAAATAPNKVDTRWCRRL